MQVKRFDYIDALRGLAILFIVFGHIPVCCHYVGENFLSYRSFTSLVQLPIFFFVSGFVFRTKNMSITGGGEFILNKFRQLIIPASILVEYITYFIMMTLPKLFMINLKEAIGLHLLCLN